MLPCREHAEHGLIAAHFHIRTHADVSDPHERIEPICNGEQERKRLHDVVAPAQVEPLMGKHMGALRFRQPERQINARPEKTEHKRRMYAIALKHILRARKAHRTAYTAVQLPERYGGIYNKRQYAERPDERTCHLPNLQRVHACHRLGHRQALRDSRIERRDADRNGRLGHHADISRDINELRPLRCRSHVEYTSVEDAQHGGNAHRAEQAECDHRPERVGIPLR